MAEVVDGNDGTYKYQYDTDKNTATLTGVLDAHKNMEIAVIPSTFLDNYAVTAIGKDAFKGCSYLRLLTLPGTLKSVNDYAFSDCKDLKHIYSKVIDPRNNLKPGGLPSNSSKNLVTLYVETPESKSNYENDPEWNGKYDRILVGPMSSEPYKYQDGNDDVTGMFYICAEGSKQATLYRGKNEKSIVVPSKIKYKDEYYNVTGIDRQAFTGYSEITTITISENVEVIGFEAFNGCSKLETIKLPSTLKSIKEQAFTGCSSLVRVECKAPAFDIPTNVFSNNPEKTLYVPDTDSYQAYEGWKRFTYFMQGTIKEGDVFGTSKEGVNMKFVCADGSQDAILVQVDDAKVVTIPYSFQGSDGKTYVVRVIQKNAFANATSIEQLSFEDKSADEGGNSLKIGESALNGCKKLKILILPKRLDRIGKSAFTSCENLSYVYLRNIPSNISSNNLGEDVFTKTQRNKATLFISEGADYNNLVWNEVHVTECMDMDVFHDSSNMEYVGWETTSNRYAILIKGNSGFNGTLSSSVSDSKTDNPYNLVAIAENAFYGIGSFKNLDIKDGIKTIGASAFKDHSELEKVTFGSSLTDIDEKAFWGCQNLAKIAFGGIKNIGGNAFRDCRKLEIITLPKSIESISGSAFAGCDYLAEIQCEKEEPIKIGEGEDFPFPNYDIILYVPTADGVNNKNEYKKKGWNFYTIYYGKRKEYTDDGLKYVYGTDDDKAALLKNENSSASIATIQESINGKTVNLIARHAFENNQSLKTISIPNGVERIGDYAFKNCKALNDFTLPSNLKTIGNNAFENNSKLQRVDIPEGVTQIGTKAFLSCTALTEVILPSTLKAKGAIGDYAFNGCNNITTITSWIENPSEISADVFTSPNIKEIYVPNGQKDVYEATLGWANYKGKYVEGEIFEAKDNNHPAMIYTCRIVGDTQTATLTRIEDTGEETSISIPKTINVTNTNRNITYENVVVTEIAQSVIQSNPHKGNIETINIEADIVTIGDNAFKDCTKLTTLKLPSTLKTIGSSAFSKALLSTLDLPESVEKIGAKAFQECSRLTKIKLPENLTSIGDQAFYNCTAITIVNSDMVFPSLGVNVFSLKDANTATLFIPEGSRNNYQGDWLQFSNIVEGEYVGETEDGGMTFVCYETKDNQSAILTKSQTNLTEALINKSVTLDEKSFSVTSIGKYAFKGCNNLKKVQLPSSLTAIGSYAFTDCSLISEIVSDIETAFPIYNVFNERTYTLAHVYIPGNMESYQKADGWKDFNNGNYEVGKWLEISKGYFKYRYHTGSKEATIIEIAFPETEETLTIDSSVDIGEGSNKVTYSVTTIAPTSFINKDKVKKLIIKEPAEGKKGIETIGANAFKDCKNLLEVELPSSLKTIGESAFRYTKLEELRLYSVETIGTTAFQGCSNLKKIWLPANLTSIGKQAFDGCSKITHVTCDATTLPASASELVSSGNNALLFVPNTDVYKGKAGWQYFIKLYEGHFVDEVTPSTPKYKDMTFICVENGQGEGMTRTAILTKSKTSTEDVEIPASVPANTIDYVVTEIDESAFSSSSNLKNIIIPEKVVKIGDNAFATCTQLTNITCKAETPSAINSTVFPNVPAALYVPNKQKYAADANWNVFSPMYTGERRVATNDVLNLTYEYATGEQVARLIKGASTVADVTIDSYVPGAESKKVTVIVVQAFSSSKNMTTLVIPEGVEVIGAGAFKGCSGLKTLTLPSSLKEIGEEAFADSKSLSVIYCGMESSEATPLFAINSNVFSSEITPTVYIPLGKNNLTAYQTTPGWDRFKNNYVVGEKDNGIDPNYPMMTFEYTTSNNTATLIKDVTPVPEDKTITIPSEVKIPQKGTFTVNAVGENVFKDNKDKAKIEKLVIGDNITKIGDNAFQGLTGLQTIKFSSNLKTIGAYAFSGNTKLEELRLPASVETIGASAFQGCSSLKKIWFRANLDSIGKQAFDGCSKLTHVSIDAQSMPSTLSEFVPYGSSAVLFVPKGKKEVYEGKTGWQYFAKIYEGRFVDEITPSTSTYKDMTFICVENGEGQDATQTAILTKSKTSTEDVVIPPNVSIDGKGTYTITEIDQSAFASSSNLKNITISENVVKIGDYAFASCTLLNNIICKADNPIAINSTVFPNVPAALYVPNKDTYAKAENWKDFSPKYNGERRVATNDVLGLTYEYATGEQVARLIKGASTVADVTIDNIVPGTDKKVTDIVAQAFSSSKNLTNLVIPENVDTIRAAAFKGCTALKTLTLPSTLKAIGEEAFADSKSLTTIYSDIAGEKLFEINTNVFSSTISPTIYIPLGENNLTAYQTTPGWDRFKNNYVVGEKDNGIDPDYSTMTFEYTTSNGKAKLIKVAAPVPEDKTITIPLEVTIPQKGTFTVNAVGENVFKDNKDKTKIEKLVISENIAKIGDNAFQGLTGLQTITFASNAKLTNIGAYAFSGNSKLEELRLPASVKTIGTSAFQGCSNLKKIWFRANVDSIGKQAFDGCSKLTHVSIDAQSMPSTLSEFVPYGSSAVLFVPKGKKEVYEGKTGWQYFAKIYEGRFVDEITPSTSTYKDMTFICVENGEGDDKTRTAILTKSKTSTEDVVIPPSVTAYDVTEIDESAFASSSNLKNIAIPEKVEKIGDNAFATCTQLTNITCKAETPSAINSTVFPNVPAALYVPNKQKYAADANWNVFSPMYTGERRVAKNDVLALTYEYATGEQGARLIKGASTVADVTIDNIVPGTDKKVTVIAAQAFSSSKNLTTLVIPEGVEVIGADAFKGCTALKTLTLPSTLTSIDEEAFADSKSLSTIYSDIAGASLFKINTNVFSSEISPIIYIPLGDNNLEAYQTTDGWSRFKNNYVTGEKLNGKDENYPTMVFEYLTGKGTATLIKVTPTGSDTKQITIPSEITIGGTKYDVTAVADNAFKENTDKAKIEKLEIGENIAQIGDNAFQGLTGLQAITFASSAKLTNIGAYAFSGNTKLEELRLPSSVKRIGTSAFQGCSSLKKVWFPANLNEIGKQAFDGCSKITHVSIDAQTRPASASELVPANSTALLFVPKGKTSVYEGKTGWQYFAKIYEGRFVDEITPSTSTYKDMTFICVENGQGEDMTRTAILTKSKTSTEDVVIPASVTAKDITYIVTEIDKSAFASSNNLKNITIPEKVEKIGDNAFATCTQLNNIICKAETPSAINSTVFPNVPAALYVPNKQKYAADANWNVFSPMYNGERRVATNDVLALTYEYATGEQGARLIKGAPTVADVTIDNIVPGTDKKVTVIAASAFSSSKNMTNLIIPENVETISAKAFKGCTALETLTLPSTLKEIGEEAFADSKSLTNIYSDVVAADLFEINTNVFSSTITPTIYIPLGDDNLEAYQTTAGWDRFKNNYVTGEKLNGIDDNYPTMVFEYLTGKGTATLIKVTPTGSNTKQITIPSEITIGGTKYSVTAVGDNAFKDNTDKAKIEKLEIGENIAKIGDNAFQGLTGLQTITFATNAKLTNIGAYAFSGSSKLEELRLPASVNTIGTSAFQGCSSLKKIWLPANLAEIGKQAFDGCNKITHVSSDALSLPTSVSELVPANSSALLFVPKGKTAAYEGKTGWQYFAKIYEGRFVDEITPSTSTYKDLTFICVENGQGEDMTRTAILTKSKTSTEDVVIPASVTAKDITYIVTEIDKSAFASSNNLKNITIPEKVEKIGDNAFATCTQLNNIICKAETPSAINSTVFPNVPAALYVPNKQKYAADANWNVFSPMYNGERRVATNDVLALTYEYATGEQGARLIKGASTVADVTIDNIVPGTDKKVTVIAASAFSSSKNLTNLIIPENVETISAKAFKGCTALETLTLPSTLKAIGEQAFVDSKALTTIYSDIVAADLFEINTNVFSSAITPTIYIPLGEDNLEAYQTTSGWDRFKNNYVTGEKLNGIDDNYPMMTFEYLTGYGTATLIKVVAPVPDNKTITIPSVVTINKVTYKVTAIGDNAFKDNTDKAKIEKLEIGENIAKIGDNAFQGLTGLQTLTFATNAKLTAIGSYAFSGNSKLEELRLPASVNTIGTSAFQGCSSLKKIWLPANLASIGKQAFDGCSKITHVNSSIKSPSAISDDVFSIADKNTATLFVTSKTGYNAGAWTKFSNVVIGEYVADKEYEGMTFACYKTIAENNAGESVTRPVAILTKSATNIQEAQIKAVTLGESVSGGSNDLVYYDVVAIGKYAFKGCTGLKKIELPSTLTAIGDYAFADCNAISEIVSDIETAFPIYNVFNERTYTIAHVYIPGNLESYQNTDGWKEFNTSNYEVGKWLETPLMGYFKYKYQTAKKEATIIEIIFPETEETLTIPGSVDIDEGSNKVTYNVTTIAPTSFINKDKVQKLIFSEKTEEKYGIETIAANAFKDCSNLQIVWLPSTLKEIESKAFNGCKSIKRVSSKTHTLPTISDDVFPANIEYLFIPEGTTVNSGWSSFAKVIEGSYVGDIKSGEGISYICMENGEGNDVKPTAMLTKAPTTITDIPSAIVYNGVTHNVTVIGESAFENNTSLVNLEIPEGVRIIRKNAFKKCSNLQTVDLPSSLKQIGEYAFDQCAKISMVTSKIEKDDLFGFKTNVFPETVFTLATVYVPYDEDGATVAWYQLTEGWKEFANYEMGEKKQAKIGYMTYEYQTATKTATLIATTISKDVVTIDGIITVDNVDYKVTTIAESVFKNNANKKSLEKLIIDENIQTIGAYAFQGCTNLKHVWLSSTIKSIGEKAFDGCSGITYVSSKIDNPTALNAVFSAKNATLYVPKGRKSSYNIDGWNIFSFVGEGEFVEVYTDNNMTIDCLKTAEGRNIALLKKYITSATDIMIPGSVETGGEIYTVTTVGKPAFIGNTKITSVIFQVGFESIDECAFQKCSALKKIDLPATLMEIGNNAFDGCNNLTVIVSRMGAPFRIDNAGLTDNPTSLYVPSGTKKNYIDADWNFSYIFEGERIEVTLDNGMTFACSTGDKKALLTTANVSAKEITIPNTITENGISYAVTSIAKSAFKSNSTLEKLTISEGITSIGESAFQNCSKLKEVTIPSTVTEIGDYAFDKCSKLELVVSHIERPCAISENVFPATGAKLNIPIGTTELYQAAGWTKQFAMTLEGEMLEKEIDGMTYNYVTGSRTATLIKGTTKEKELTIPAIINIDGTNYSLTAIGESAFVNQNTLEKLYIDEGIASIGANAFKNCAYLTLLSLPSTLNSIGDNAFSKCDRLAHVQCSVNTPFNISDNVFTTTAYQNATLYVPVYRAEDYADTNGWKNFTSVLEGSISEVIVEGMTYICVSNLKIAKLIKGVNTKEVTVPSKIYKGGVVYKVVSIEKSAFYGFSTLEKLVVSENVETIGVTAFKNCSKLKSVELPASLDSIGASAFENCSRLELVVCAGKEPAAISANTFPSIEFTVNVPSSTAATAYREHQYWGKYTINVTMSSISEDDEDEERPGIYQIITEEGEEEYPTVAIIGDAGIYGNFELPETIDYSGTTYTVTVIAPGTFENNVFLTDISIPSTIIAIGESAFAGCSNLKSITVNIDTPLDLTAESDVRDIMKTSGGSSIFEGVDLETCILYVPDGSVELYKAADVWKEFKNIRPISSAGMNGVFANDGKPFDVYNMQGVKVRVNTRTLKGLPSGIYIVNGKKINVK